MQTNRDGLRYAVQEFLNDVIEQGFHHLVNYPQSDNELSLIIKEATEELNYQLLRIDSHQFPNGSKELVDHYMAISKDTQKISLELLSRLQRVQERDIPRLRRV